MGAAPGRGPAMVNRPVVRRAAWGLLDQAVSSVTNFAVGALIARSVDPEDFGSFSLSFLAYTIFLNAERALATTPLIVRYSGSTGGEWRIKTAAATGVALAVGVVCGAVCLVIAGVTSGSLQVAFLVMGLMMPGLLLQDAWRFAFFARGAGHLAFVNDLISAIVMVPAFAVALSNRQWPPIATLVLAWGGGTAIAAVAGCLQAGAIPSLRGAPGWLREHRDIAPRFLLEFTTQSGLSQFGLVLVGVVAGLAAIGAIRAGQLLLGPLNVVFMGLELVVVPEAVTLARRSTRSLAWFVRLFGAGGAVASAAYGTLLLLLPSALGVFILGPNWDQARSVLLPLTIGLVASCLQEIGVTGLRALAAADISLRTRLVSSSLNVLGAVAGGAAGGAVGAAWGLALMSILGAGVWWTQFQRGVARVGPRVGTSPVAAPPPLAPL